jgi:hypothetical protein
MEIGDEQNVYCATLSREGNVESKKLGLGHFGLFTRLFTSNCWLILATGWLI